ncbi:hypothetical protein Acr_10g0010230 [Actinidia rufa]|uniref:Uncharacterized protein n=1 Tax=Actinidia rufa TaxID=165716 RepID=A0A7J0FAB0_9ERIC|nr:hypothetical protein Acr_10g0010230 [Actinidia rufa]
MAMMEGLWPGPMFDSLFKNVPKTLSALQSKADKYIIAEELAEAKCRRRGKDDHKRKEPDTRRSKYKEETRNKRSIRNEPMKDVLVLHLAAQNWFYLPSMLPSPRNLIKKGYLRKYIADRPLPNSPERRYGANRPTAGDIQVIHGGFGSGGCSSSSRKRHTKNANGRDDEEVYNLSSSVVGIL